MQRATIDDVAELAGVSIKTVSRVVNNEPNVRDATRKRVEKAIDKLNYRPNKSARNLASQRSHLIVLVYDDPSAYEVPSSGYVVRMQQGMLQACRTTNYELVIHPCDYRSPKVGAELRSLIEQTRPDGVVIAAPLSNMPKIVNAIAKTRTPYVRLSPGEGSGKQFYVATNDREIAAEMTRYLASLGHRRIAFIKGHPEHDAVGNRFDGYMEGLESAGLPYSEVLVASGDNSIGSGEACAESLLDLASPPTAIFAANDDMAAGVIRVAYRRGIKVPDQLSVAGCDDGALARQVYPALTTIRQPLAKMAERAALALIMESGPELQLRDIDIVAAGLRVRDSTGSAPD